MALRQIASIQKKPPCDAVTVEIQAWRTFAGAAPEHVDGLLGLLREDLAAHVPPTPKACPAIAKADWAWVQMATRWEPPSNG